MKINIKTIDESKHRYPTLGDYFKKDKDVLQVNITDLGNKDYEFLILIHELVEWHLTENRGIKEENIMKFDIQFEKERKRGIHNNEVEPGDAIDSPYRKEHRFAENIERILAHELGIDFNDYSKHLLNFIESKIKKFPDKINDKIGK